MMFTNYHTNYHTIYHWVSDVISRFYRISKKCANKQPTSHFLLYCMVNVVNRVNNPVEYWRKGCKRVENAQTNDRMGDF
jgi:hypothetical protein